MSEPKFSIGDRVAVCTTNLSVVIPETIVRDRVFEPIGWSVNLGRVECDLWLYKVDGEELWIHERCLRPIEDDEYTDPLTTSREVSA